MTTVTKPIVLNGREFASMADVQTWVKEQAEQVKQGRALLKENKPGREPSVKSKIADEVANLLNSDAQVLSICNGVGSNFSVRLTWDSVAKTFTPPAVHSKRAGGNNSANMGAREMIVDGTAYKSAALAIHTLCPETLKKPMSRDQIKAYLRSKDHGEHEVSD